MDIGPSAYPVVASGQEYCGIATRNYLEAGTWNSVPQIETGKFSNFQEWKVRLIQPICEGHERGYHQ